jgi:prevent-host-death family protein
MINTPTVNIRDILRNHKQILERVKNKKERVIVASQDKPQVGIVSIDDLQRLEELEKQEKNKRSTKSLLETAKKIREVLKDENLPANLGEKHDFYHYEEEIKKH